VLRNRTAVSSQRVQQIFTYAGEVFLKELPIDIADLYSTAPYKNTVNLQSLAGKKTNHPTENI
jgi:hypothetical protein